ncbi:GTP pyrophosphokinase [Bacillus sp. 1P06AnD]|uniref:GTP pyrophosphokinase n=1 Tax=Bacillus sp. 1P06AnD TaxID=3132208 RepID=UPI0039A0B003
MIENCPTFLLKVGYLRIIDSSGGMKMNNPIEKALEIALHAHAGQTDKGGKPYILHPLRVMNSVEGDYLQIIAILHDVVEDSGWSLNDLSEVGFSASVIRSVDCLTKREGEDYQTYLSRVKSDPLAVQVKRADLMDNSNLSRILHPTDEDLQRVAKYAGALAFLDQ